MVRTGWLLLVLGLAACATHFERPVLSVAGIDLKKGSNLLQQVFLVRFEIQNPNDRPLPVTGLHADLALGGDKIASGVTERAFVVPAHGQSDFDMTITANVALALLKLAGNPHADAIDYQLTGEASLDLPFMHSVPFQQRGSLSLRGGQSLSAAPSGSL